MEETKSVTTTLGFNAQWGKFGAEILLKNWDKVRGWAWAPRTRHAHHTRTTRAPHVPRKSRAPHAHARARAHAHARPPNPDLP